MNPARFSSAELKSFQKTEKGRDRFDLGFGQVMRDRLHDRGAVRLGLILTPLLFPIGQFFFDVVIELTCQAWKYLGALGFRPVTGGAWRDLGAGNAVFIDFFPRSHEFFWSTS